MSLRKRLITYALVGVTLLGASIIIPQVARADAVHSRVKSGYFDTAGNPIEYTENKNNAYSGGAGHAQVSVGGWFDFYPFTPDGVNDVYGAEIYAYHYGPGKCNCWAIDAAQAHAAVASANADETNQPCEWVLWYVWDNTSGSPVIGGNFC